MTWDDSAHEDLSSDDEPDSQADGVVVSIANQQTEVAVDEASLIAASRQILHDAGFRRGELSIAIVDDETMHALNRQYLNHDYPTDVLSFPLECKADWLEGEIIISADTAAREAAEVGWEAGTEMLLYVVHGTLHLIGHDDHDPVARQAMRLAERRYLEMMGVALTEVDQRLPDAEEEDEPSWGDSSWEATIDPSEETE